MELLRQLVPRAGKIGVLLDANQSDFADQLRDAEAAMPDGSRVSSRTERICVFSRRLVARTEHDRITVEPAELATEQDEHPGRRVPP